MVLSLALENVPPAGTLLTEALVFVVLVLLSAFVSGSEVALIGFPTGAVTFVMLTFAEILPKAYAATHGESWALSASPLLVGLQRVLYPFVWAYDRFTNALFKSMKGGEHGAANLVSEEEIKTVI